MWRCFEVTEEVYEEVVWVGGACVFILGGVCLMGMRMRMCAFVMFFWGVAVGEDYDFVDAEDGEGACYVAAERGSKFMGLCAELN